MSHELIIFLVSGLPFVELRLGLPLGIAFGLTPYAAFFLSTLGTLTATIIAIYLLDPVVQFIRRYSKPLNKLVEKIFAKTRHAHSEKFNRFGALFLLLFVAVPIPGSGGYTGALIAYLFDIPKKYAVLLVGTGVILSGFVMLAIVTGGLELFQWLSPAPHQLEAIEGLIPTDLGSYSAPQLTQ